MEISFTDLATAFKTITDTLPHPTDEAILVDVEVANLHVNPLTHRWTRTMVGSDWSPGGMGTENVNTLKAPLASDQLLKKGNIDGSTFAIDHRIESDILQLLICYQIGDDPNAGFVVGCSVKFNTRSASKFVLLCDPQLHLIEEPGSANSISEGDYWMLFKTVLGWPVALAAVPSKRGGNVPAGTYTQGESESATITHGTPLVRQHAAWRVEAFMAPNDGNNYELRVIVSDKGQSIPADVIQS
ncbi:MAG: hypothetical protein AB7Q42_17115 [Acidimicrobiia bacterium]